jgi:hypothetical protein
MLKKNPKFLVFQSLCESLDKVRNKKLNSFRELISCVTFMINMICEENIFE